MTDTTNTPATPEDQPTYPFVPITFEQAREVLNRIRWFAYHEYCTAAGAKRFEAMQIEHDGRPFSCSVQPNGEIALKTTDGLTVLYAPQATVCPPRRPDTLEHAAFGAVIVNRDTLSEADLKWAQNAAIFVLSYFQRNLAFSFLAMMQPETIEGYASALAAMTNSPATASSE